MHWFQVLGSLQKPNNWSDLAGDERGVAGDAWGGGMGQGKREEMGGGRAPEQCEQQGCIGSTFWAPLKTLTISLIWLVTRGGWG